MSEHLLQVMGVTGSVMYIVFTVGSVLKSLGDRKLADLTTVHQRAWTAMVLAALTLGAYSLLIPSKGFSNAAIWIFNLAMAIGNVRIVGGRRRDKARQIIEAKDLWPR